MRSVKILFAFVALLYGNSAVVADNPQSLISNGNFESDSDTNRWPDGWPRVDDGTWVEEAGNRFLRLRSPEAGKMVMLYREIAIPEGVEAIEFSWRQRITGLKVGKNSWFDARVLLEFLDADRNKVAPNPSAPASRKDTDGWQQRRTAFLVPEGARTLKWMPCLFQVAAGTFDLDDITLQRTDAGPLRAAAAKAAAERLAKQQASAAKRREKAAELLAEQGTLILNGDFESNTKQSDWPDHWGRPKSGSWISEAGNHFLRLDAVAGELVSVYRTVDIPADVQALELSWRQRVTGLQKGKLPWYDARIMLDLIGIDGKKLKQPSPPYTQKDTDGWVRRSSQFLVPPEALSLALMPSLFQVQAGRLDLDDLTLRPVDPAPLLAKAKQRAAEIAARHVPFEKPDQTKWPSQLKVVGNRVHDVDGNEVWLQGVNVGGLETLPHDRQMIKSAVVAIDQWKANVIRVPMKESFWYGHSPYQKDEGKEYREIIDQIITLAANRGAYVVIDLHRYRAPKQEHADFWVDFATRYKNHPALLFDLLNEPHGISWKVWQRGGRVETPDAVDESAFLSDEEKRKNSGFESIGMQAMVDAVRSTGAKNIVIAGGIFWCNDLSGITQGYALQDPTGNGIMYSWHTYNWHTDWEAKVLATAAKHPILLGEVGADINKMNFIPADAQEDPYTWVPDMLGFIQRHRLNWTGWCFHPKATPVMISDWSYTPTPFWGQFAKEALSGKPFELRRTR
ncbi:Endoglucanase A precursor [Rosistilla carotiformis]|uniref:Endoglucanase A n=1 Tax=Rosistilla carotiformis TaxID=2528017 RepID=A0A518JLL3_9BACT|nr:glycoside hydrolase family 5 protein [Rosistilla carotiformis]QDV66387.1 Endoglucanase A precursor [Rosistilla carotiformis]